MQIDDRYFVILCSKYHITSHHMEKTEAGQLIKTKNARSNSTEGNKDISRVKG